jgi:hypothetical protein
MDAMLGTLSLSVFTYCVAAIFLAGLIRGYCGFGFSALVVASLTLVLPPVEVIPFVFMLEIAASIGMLPAIWREIDRRLLGWLLSGYVFGAPLGLYALVQIDQATVRIIISLIILILSIALLRGFVFRAANHAGAIFSTGIVAGAVNGVSAVGGLPVVLLMLANTASAAVTRASIVAFLMLGNIYATAFTFGSGLITSDVIIRFAVFLVPMALGVLLGSRQFVRSNPESFKTLALWLLIGLASVGLLRLAV